ncbi:butyrophilin subfamily 1 member A1-like [Rhynchocyon petersi]
MEGSSSCPWLCRLTSLLLLLQVPSWGSADEFIVIGPKDPIVAVLGKETTLPCSLSPAMNMKNMELRWFRSKYSEAVFIYQDQQEQKTEQMPQYAGRTSLVRDLLSQGEAAVQIDRVQVSDNGMYTCFIKKGNFYEEATMEVKVAGVGSAPELRIEGLEEDGVRVVCTASGWFPKPQVQWRDLSGKKFLAFEETHAQDSEGLFHVEASLVVKDSTAGNMTCSILNPILDQEKVKAIFIPEPFFPQASPWKPAFAVSTIILGLLILSAAYFTKKERSAKLEAKKEQRSLQRTEEEDRQIKEGALKARDELRAELDRRKKIYQAGSFTLDPCSAHPSLALRQENMSLTWKENYDIMDESRCSVLGLGGITSGLCYWEVEARREDNSEWAVGVCRGNVDRNGWYRETPEKGFWVVGQFSDGFCACVTSNVKLTLRQVPYHVGIFLDYEGGDISFYNMTDGSHIFSFSEASFSEDLFPYFLLRSGNISLTICTKVDGPKRFPGFREKSLTEPLSPLGEVLSPDSCDDGALPGAESPLLSPHHHQALSPKNPSDPCLFTMTLPGAADSLR